MHHLPLQSYPEDLEAFKLKAENTFYDYRDPATGMFGYPPPVLEAIKVLEKVSRGCVRGKSLCNLLWCSTNTSRWAMCR